MFDVKSLVSEVRKELADEASKAAKTKIKAAMKRVDDAKKILRNAEDELEVILKDIGA